MSPGLDRRSFVTTGVFTVVGSSLAFRSQVRAQEVNSPQTLTTYQVGPHIWVRCAGQPFTSYRAHPTQKYPYLYPVAGPLTGLSLTIESGEPWPHHRSVLFGCDRVNGANYWQESLERGQIISRGPAIAESQGERVIITDACDWRIEGQPTDFTDERRLTFSAPSPVLRLIETEITLTAARAVHIERTNHSLFAVRAAPDITPNGGGTLVNSERQVSEKGTFGQKATWCTYYGRRFGMTEGIALLDHPQNPWAPCPWFTRDYGFISPTPMQWLGNEGLTLAPGDSFHLRYLVVAYAGTPDEVDLNGILFQWAG
ncbi:MAG: PmoA family protein [Candidatus Zipacnadales bacterium]